MAAPGSSRARDTRATRSARSWPGHATAALAFAFAAVSFYWGLGGRIGLETLGGRIEAMALARDPVLVALVWVTGFLKVLAGVLALALVQPWGRRLPRRGLLIAAWSGGVVLTVYGLLQVTSVALVLSGAVTPDQPIEATVLWWRFLLWEPWFLVLGALLALTAWDAGPATAGHGRGGKGPGPG